MGSAAADAKRKKTPGFARYCDSNPDSSPRAKSVQAGVGKAERTVCRQ